MRTFIANDFKSETPVGWEDRSTITLVGPVHNGFASNIVVTRQPLPKGTSVTEFATTQLDQLAKEVPSLLIEDERSANLNGRELYQRLHQFDASDNMAIKQVQTYLVHTFASGTVGLVITGTSAPDGFDAAMPAFKQFVNAFDVVE